MGIDVSKNKLDCALIDNSNPDKFKFKVVSNSEDGFIALPVRPASASTPHKSDSVKATSLT